MYKTAPLPPPKTPKNRRSRSSTSLLAMLLACLIVAAFAACGGDTTDPTATAIPTSVSVEPTQVPTSPPPAPTQEPTSAPEPTRVPDPTDPPAPTQAPEPTVEPTTVPVPTDTPVPPPTPMPEDTPTPTPEDTPTPTPEATATPAPTPEPDEPQIAQTLAPLGNNLIWVAHYDNATRGWSVYDPSSTLSPEDLPLPPGQAAPDAASIGLLTELIPNKLYWVSVTNEQTVKLGELEVVFKPPFSILQWK